MADMGFSDAVRSVFSKYATFSGRARRAEYWWFALFNVLASLALQILDLMIFGVYRMGPDEGAGLPNVLGGLFSLAILLPAIAVWVRRLHDVGRSGWWWLLAFIPVIGWIILFYWSVRRGDVGANSFGPDPVGDDENDAPLAIPRVSRN